MGRAMVVFAESRAEVLSIKGRRAFRKLIHRDARWRALSPAIFDRDRGDAASDLVETIVL